MTSEQDSKNVSDEHLKEHGDPSNFDPSDVILITPVTQEIFWQEVCKVFLPINTNWRSVIEQMPERIDAEEVLKRLQTADQLSIACAHGYDRENGKVLQIDKQVVLEHLQHKPEPANLWFQIYYQFCIADGVCTTFRDKPLVQWPVPFLCLLEEIFQFMVYMSALLYLADADSLPETYDATDWLRELEPEVKKIIKSVVDLLCSKGEMYGQSYRKNEIVGLLPRIWDKMARYIQLKSSSIVNFESRTDTAKDLLGYAIIGWSLLLELEESLGNAHGQTSLTLTLGL